MSGNAAHLKAQLDTIRVAATSLEASNADVQLDVLRRVGANEMWATNPEGLVHHLRSITDHDHDIARRFAAWKISQQILTELHAISIGI